MRLQLRSHTMESPAAGTAIVGGSHLSCIPMMRALWFNFGIMLIPAQTYFPQSRWHGRLPCFRPHESLHVNTLSMYHQHVARAVWVWFWLCGGTTSRDRPLRTTYQVSLHLGGLPKLTRRAVYAPGTCDGQVSRSLLFIHPSLYTLYDSPSTFIC
jgi:hypothetical protein